MAIHLPETLDISDWDETHQPCRFCGEPHSADPDNLDAWAAHLVALHGYRIVTDQPRTEQSPRTIRLQLFGWSTRAKFGPNDRVDANDHAPGDYEGRRGTIVGWHPGHTEYCVAFGEYPPTGWLSPKSLERFVKRSA